MRTQHLERVVKNPPLKMMLGTLVLISAITCLESAHASELGRLFYTPEQRVQLETQKTTGVAAEGGKRNFIVVNGVIQKQGGNRTVWLNGEAQTPVRANNNPASIDVAVPGKSKHVQVKVGQRLLLDTPSPSDAKNSPAKPSSDDD
ncbi:MAG: hypothetical protein C0406_01870 [Sideroxydans sp.]|nr:hypothetical protein [Sideroxydans sp.]